MASIAYEQLPLQLPEIKLCECGCGEPAPLAKYSYRAKGLIKGQPQRYVRNHSLNVLHRLQAIEATQRRRARDTARAAASTPAIPLPERFWSCVDQSGGPMSCWLWTGHRDKYGYGRFNIGAKNGQVASRVVWALTYGPPPPGLEVCHNCPGGDNPACVNPAHLWLGTHLENMRDRSLKHPRLHPRKAPKHSKPPRIE